MPKAAKKKNNKEKDFAKPKLKVGKTKTTNASHTSTSFQSKAIYVPKQNMVDPTKRGQEITSRNQTMKDLLSHCQHPNVSMRKDSLLGMMELLDRYDYLAVQQLSIVTRTTVKMILDMDRSVRKVLLQLYATHYSQLDESIIRPFFSILMVYTCSGMTHILEDIRLDALKFLSLWLQYFPRLTVEHGANRVLPNFLNLLGGRSMSAASIEQTQDVGAIHVVADGSLTMNAARLEVLQKFTQFMETALGEDSGKENVTADECVPTIVYARQSLIWNAGMDLSACVLGRSALTFEALQKEDAGDGSQAQGLAQGRALLDSLQPVMVHLWMECVPNIFDVSTVAFSSHLEGSQNIVRLMNLLWKQALQSPSTTTATTAADWMLRHLKSITRYFLVRFPFGKQLDLGRDVRVGQAFRSMNVYFAEMMSTFLGAYPRSEPLPAWSKEMVQFTVDYFDVDTPSISSMQVDHVSVLLKVVDQLLRVSDRSVQESLLLAVFTFYGRCSPTAPVKEKLYRYLRELVWTQYQDKHFLLVTSDHVQQATQKWLVSLPRYLWELKCSHTSTTQSILRLLTAVIRRERSPKPILNCSDDWITTLHHSLVPFFCAEHKGKVLQGPFLSLSEEVQREVVSLLVQLLPLAPKLQLSLDKSLSLTKPELSEYVLGLFEESP